MSPPAPTPALTFPFPEFRLNDVVYLVGLHGNVSAGACGRIVGRYARDTDPRYVVSFEDQLCNDVRADEIVPANAA
jgi:hypothetical protein